MNTRPFGKTNIQVTEVGLGCWQFGGDWGDITDDNALAVLKAASDAGIRFLDTADVYGAGRSETIIGKFLKTTRHPFFVATKLGRLQGYPDDYTFDLFRGCTEASLQRLGKEALDLTQLHCLPTDVLRRGEVFDWLRKLQQQGKIKHWGASVESMDEALLCLDQDGLASLQIIFNIFRQKPIDVLFDKAKAKGVALIVRLPLASGLLTGKFNARTEFDECDHRNYNRDGQMFNVGETFAGLKFEDGIALVNALKPRVPVHMSMAQYALRWILDHDAVSVVIPGAKNPDHVHVNASASYLPALEASEHTALHKFYKEEVASHIRGPY